MYFNKTFQKFCKDKNLKDSTIKGYASALKNYSEFHEKTLDELIKEALTEEKKNVPLKERKIKSHLLNYRNHLLESNLTPKTSKTYFSKIKTFYRYLEIEIPNLPNAKYNKSYETNYLDLPTHKHLYQAMEIIPIDLKAIILFMSSSGTAKAETLSITLEQFITATQDYHNGGSIEEVLTSLEHKNNIIPTFYLKRIKTDKYYYTFCSPESTTHIIRYLKTRKNLKLDDKLFDISSSTLTTKFQEINDKLGWGFKGKHRFFRSHTLRKFHASNIGLTAEYIDALQGRGKNEVHDTYIKTNPKKLKEIYKKAMHNVMIYQKQGPTVKKQEFNIIINIFLSGKEYNIQ